MAYARTELSDFITKTADKVYFVENESTPFQPTYQNIFKSTPLMGREKMESSGMFNINIQKRGDYSPTVYTDPSSGRRIYAKKDLYDAGTRIPRRLTDGMDVRRPSDELVNFVANWTRGFMNRYRIDLEQFAYNHFNYGGYTAGNAIFNGTNDVQDDPSGDLLYDSYPLFNLSNNTRSLLRKPVSVSTNAFSNSLGASSADLNAANFEIAFRKITKDNAYDDAGQPLIQDAGILLVPSELRAEAFNITDTNTGSPGETNYSANPNYKIVDTMISRFLTDSDAWFVISNNGMWEIFDQEAPVFRSWEDPDTGLVYIKGEVCYGSCIKSWQNVAGGNIATS